MCKDYLNAVDIPIILLDKSFNVLFTNNNFNSFLPFFPFTTNQIATKLKTIFKAEKQQIKEIITYNNEQRFVIHASKIENQEILVHIEQITQKEHIYFRKYLIKEFTNRFTSIFNNLFTSLKKATENSNTRNSLKVIEEAVNRGVEILDILESYSDNIHGYNSQISFSPREIIEETISETLKIWSQRGLLKNLKYLIEFEQQSDNKIFIKGDPQAFKTAIIHIIKNGFESMKKGGLIVIEEVYSSEKLIYILTDHGEGISPDKHNIIFEPFYSTKKGHQGLGLSLSLAIIEKHYGKLKLLLSVPEETKFQIELPLNTISRIMR